MRPVISVVISTYNRARSLESAIASVIRQADPPAYELIVVDNRSTDETAAVVRRIAAQHSNVRYVYEERQGVSYGRNAGIDAAGSDLLAFTDDDVAVAPDWLRAILRAAEEHPECGCIGGKVLPRWPKAPPPWLTERHWAPLALLDYGGPQRIDAGSPRCLITANMAIRREVFDRIGRFRPEFQKTAGSTCSNEDRELQERYWRAGGLCWFDPRIVVEAEIQPERLTKSYHRQWHFSHGQLHAALRDPEFEQSGFRMLDVPGHVWRRLGTSLLLTGLSLFRRQGAFDHEIEARFFAGFIRARLAAASTRA
jgi:glycosyltransferase involved in cell wall biosynthesis